MQSSNAPQQSGAHSEDGLSGLDEFEAAAKELRALQQKMAAYGSATSTLGDLARILGGIGREMKELPERLQPFVSQSAEIGEHAKTLTASLIENRKMVDTALERFGHLEFEKPILALLNDNAAKIDAKLVAVYRKLDARMNLLEQGNAQLLALAEKAAERKKGFWTKLTSR